MCEESWHEFTDTATQEQLVEEGKIVEDYLELKRLLGIIICFHNGSMTKMMKMKNYPLTSLLD